MERMWRRVSGKNSKKLDAKNEDEVKFDGSVVRTPSAMTGRRLANSGNFASIKPISSSGRDTTEEVTYINHQKTLSQYVVQKKQSGMERSRRKRHRNRCNRQQGISCIGGGGEDMSSSGGFYTINESLPRRTIVNSNFVPPGTVLMYPSSRMNTSLKVVPQHQPMTGRHKTQQHQEISIRQRAIAKLRMLNFNLNWDLQIPQCKPCGSGISGKGNIITRRLCRSRGREDNELYRSNSFKFERFERKESMEVIASSIQTDIPLCDDYSLPVDFLKKRPHSFGSCLTNDVKISTEVVSNLKQIGQEENQLIPSQSYLPSPTQNKNIAVDIEHFEKPKDSILPAVCQSSLHISQAKQDLAPVKVHIASKEFIKRRKRRKKTKKSKSYSSNISNKTSESNLLNQTHEHSSSDSSIPKTSEDEQPQPAPVDSDIESVETIKEVDKEVKNVQKVQKSPYYYSDLMKNKTDSDANETITTNDNDPVKVNPSLVKSENLQSSLFVVDGEPECFELFKRYSFTEEGVHIIRCGSPSTTTSEDSNCSQCQTKSQQSNKFSKIFRKSFTKKQMKFYDAHQNIDLNGCNCFLTEIAPLYKCQTHNLPQCLHCPPSKANHCETLESLSDLEQQMDKMSATRRRNFYETAFDSKVTKSEEDLLEVDRLTNQTLMLASETVAASSNAKKFDSMTTNIGKYAKTPAATNKEPDSAEILKLTDEMNNLELDKPMMNKDKTAVPHLMQCSYTASPPATAPLSLKFNGKQNKFYHSNVLSASNLNATKSCLDSGNGGKLQIPKHERKSSQESLLGSESVNNIEDKNFQASSSSKPKELCRPKHKSQRPTHLLQLVKNNAKQRHRTFSSNDSIITSSSEGSVESLRSTTSEGNCSSSCSESRRSTSLSSHSSESNVVFNLKTPVKINSKRHILSPISDKSSLEPNLEFLEQSKSNHLAKDESLDTSFATERTESVPHDLLKRKKIPSNKFLQNLADELPFSDSGISIHSREDGKNFNEPGISVNSENCNSENPMENPLKNRQLINLKLSSSMKSTAKPILDTQLKQKRILDQENFTSGSATSVDLGDLPFDMPKLRRKLRANQIQMNFKDNTESSGVSQASSSHSIPNEQSVKEPSMFRRNLTLNFDECKSSNKFSSLDLKGLALNKDARSGCLMQAIDIAIPLERQGWYHGAITRIEAESTLRPLNEGSFLVRNCESAKQDYSLSLKGAKGFMHMRIQRNEMGHFVLGQFSRPFDSIPKMIQHFCLNRLPVRGAEHMCLIQPVISQVL